MSKMDIARGMSLDEMRKREQPKLDLSEAEILEMRLTLLQQMDMEKLKSTSELMKTLKDLHGLIRTATSSVQEAAREVRAYPAEAVRQVTVQAERSVKNCSEAAEEAQRTYKAAKSLVSKVENYMALWVLGTSLLTGSCIGAIVLFTLR